jgi:hypothetical protein
MKFHSCYPGALASNLRLRSFVRLPLASSSLVPGLRLGIIDDLLEQGSRAVVCLISLQVCDTAVN